MGRLRVGKVLPIFQSVRTMVLIMMTILGCMDLWPMVSRCFRSDWLSPELPSGWVERFYSAHWYLTYWLWLLCCCFLLCLSSSSQPLLPEGASLEVIAMELERKEVTVVLEMWYASQFSKNSLHTLSMMPNKKRKGGLCFFFFFWHVEFTWSCHWL